MNEPVVPVPVAEEPQGAPSAVRAGQLLRQAREAMGLHVAALAVSLKVPVGKLEALEAGQLDALPDVTFARALAASVCRTLKIDPAPVLAHFPQGEASRLGVAGPAINTPFRPPHSGPRFAIKGQMPSASVLAVVFLLLAALAVFLWPKGKEELVDASSATDLPVVPAPEVVQVDGAAMPAAPTSLPASGAIEPLPAAASAIAEPVTPPVAVAAPSLPASGSAVVQLTAKAESWVKVTDAKGVVAVSRTLNPGEVVEATGAMPMALVVGRVDAVQVQVRGQTFDMAPFAKDRVARFEVK